MQMQNSEPNLCATSRRSRRLWQPTLVAAICVAVVAVLLGACGRSVPSQIDDPQRSVYYWRTALRLDSAEREFLARNDVRRMYLHMFDVERQGAGRLLPTNTLAFEDTLPRGIDIVPTVFIAPHALRDSAGVGSLPRLIWKRVGQMLTQNGYAPPRELQIDYDWTSSDAQTYFIMLDSLRQLLEAKGNKLSVTIRLHQLSMPVPPAHYGVLMVYNVGDFKSAAEPNSILSVAAVKPYLSHLRRYRLPLCAALPVFGWDVQFSHGRFVRLLRGVDVMDTALFRPRDSVRYECIRYMAPTPGGATDAADQRIYPGDVVRREQCSAQLIAQVMRSVEAERPGICRQTVLYHLDSKQLKRYTNDEIKDIYSYCP